MMKAVLGMSLMICLVALSADEWKAMIMPKASMFLQVSGEHLSVMKMDKLSKTDEDKLEKAAEKLEKAAVLLGGARKDSYEAMLDILYELIKLPSFKTNVTSLRLCENLSISKEQVMACSLANAIALDELEMRLKEECAVTRCKIGEIPALNLVEDEQIFKLFFVDEGKLMFLAADKQAEAVAKRLKAKKYEPFTAEMEYLLKELTGNFRFCLEITPALKAKIVAKANEKMANSPMHAMMLMKFASMTGISLNVAAYANGDDKKGVHVELGLCNANAEGAQAVKAEWFDGMVLPMTASLGEVFAPGRDNLRAYIKGRQAVLSVKLTTQDLGVFTKGL